MRYEERARLLIIAAGFPEPVKEFKFHPKRRWRFDLAWPELKLAIEIEGGVWIRGRHVRGRGFKEDCEKYNAAVLLGWKVLRYTPDMFDKMLEDLKAIFSRPKGSSFAS